MTLIIDAGALYAQADADDEAHKAVIRLLKAERGLIVTSELAVAEADHLILDRLGVDVEIDFLTDLVEGTFSVECLSHSDLADARGLVARSRFGRWHPSKAVSSSCCRRTTDGARRLLGSTHVPLDRPNRAWWTQLHVMSNRPGGTIVVPPVAWTPKIRMVCAVPPPLMRSGARRASHPPLSGPIQGSGTGRSSFAERAWSARPLFAQAHAGERSAGRTAYPGSVVSARLNPELAPPEAIDLYLRVADELDDGNVDMDAPALTWREVGLLVGLIEAWRAHEHRKHIALKHALARAQRRLEAG